MSLFNFNSTPAELNKSSLLKSIEASRFADSSALKFLEECNHKATLFISDANFSSYQLLNSLLDKFGQSDVWITSYGISETVMRQISTRKQAGLIDNLHFIFSDHVKRIKPAEMQIAESIATSFCYYPCHAKIIAIRNQNHHAVITSSMNMNRNNKLESGAISFDPEVTNSFIDKLNEIICNSPKNN